MSITFQLNRRKLPPAAVVIDDADSDLSEIGWYETCKYPSKMIDGKMVRLHRVVLERMLGRPISSGMLADHINGNTFDCRRSNLREVTPRENCQNVKMYRNNTSGYRGVAHYKNQNGYYGYATRDQKMYHGPFRDTAIEAAHDAAKIRESLKFCLRNEEPTLPPFVETATEYVGNRRRSTIKNKSGYLNVSWNSRKKLWKVTVQFQGEIVHGGYFNNKEVANEEAIRIRSELR